MEIDAALCGGVQGVENGDRQWVDSCGRSIFYLVGRKLSAQAKVDGSHYIELGIWGSHDHKYLAHGADILLHASFLNGLLLDCKDSRAYLVKKYL